MLVSLIGASNAIILRLSTKVIACKWENILAALAGDSKSSSASKVCKLPLQSFKVSTFKDFRRINYNAKLQSFKGP